MRWETPPRPSNEDLCDLPDVEAHVWTSGQVRLLVAHEDAAVRARLRAAFAADDGLVVCKETDNASGAITGAIQQQPHVCLLSLELPGDAFAACWEIRGRLPAGKIVMLADRSDTGSLFRALSCGADDYLLTDTSPDRLPHAIRDVLAGKSAIPRELVGAMADRFRLYEPRRRMPIADGEITEHLTSREWEVFELLRDGLSTAEIADRLSVTCATVRSHVAAIVRKLRVTDRAAAVRLLEAPGLVPTER